jgi:16S rRNA (guanine527-N7)-methyltransferase
MNELELLTKGLNSLGCSLSPEPLMAYLELLSKWNKAYNLTAIRDLENMVTHHILDSLAIIPWINGVSLLDVGTGAGLPGIPLAMALPSLNVVLLDSNGKKIRFLREVKRALQLTNIEIVQTRVEAYHPPSGFDTVTSRAFSTIESFIQCTQHLLSAQGIWLAMKGRFPDTELETIHHPYRVETYAVPGISGERCCVIINKE